MEKSGWHAMRARDRAAIYFLQIYFYVCDVVECHDRLPFLILHDLCAAASGDRRVPAMMWSAVNGSSGRAPSPQM